jgi:hypothetical protein
MKTMNKKIWDGEYWGMSGALVESILTLPKSVWENGLLTAVIERVSNFYSATGTAQKMREKGIVWVLRYYACAAATFFFWVTAYILTDISCHITSSQYDVMGTVGAKFGFKKIAKNFLLAAIRLTLTSAPLHERALPICQFLLLEAGNGTYNEELYYSLLCNYLEVPADMWPDQNQLGRVLKTTIKYETQTGRNEMAAAHQALLEKIDLDKDQRVKCGLEK